MTSPHAPSARSRVPANFARPALAAAALAACGCASPEAELAGCWEQVEWRYERLDVDATRWTDGVRPREFPERDFVQHRAEWWRVEPRGEIRVAMPDGEVVRGRWRMKGRGHVLTIRRSQGSTFEVYDIEELDDEQLILQYDLGMEVRGVARLRFRRSHDGHACAPRTAAHSNGQRGRT